MEAMMKATMESRGEDKAWIGGGIGPVGEPGKIEKDSFVVEQPVTSIEEESKVKQGDREIVEKSTFTKIKEKIAYVFSSFKRMMKRAFLYVKSFYYPRENNAYV